MSFVELASYDNYIDAHIALGRLLDEHIVCHLVNENSVTLDPFLSNAIGGIKLMVAAVQKDRAAAILNDNAE